MNKFVLFVLAAFLLLGTAFGQNVPFPIDAFGGYSYYSFELPANPNNGTASTRLALNGWDVSVSAFRFHHLSVEADLAGHSLNDCNSTLYSCSNLSYIFGPRYNFRGSSRITGFVHGLVGQDRATLSYNGSSLTDTSLAIAAGGGVDYWFFRHIGVQLGPVDYFYTRHLSDYALPSQSNYRISAGVAFRFGGDYGEAAPKSARASRRDQSATQASSSSTVSSGRQPAAPSSSLSARGMPVAMLGIVVGPQEFDGAKIVEVDPGGAGEMASLKAGDLIKTVDGKPIRTPMELAVELSDKTGKVKIGIQRGDFSTETVILLNTR
jgi:hypothetical protein